MQRREPNQSFISCDDFREGSFNRGGLKVMSRKLTSPAVLPDMVHPCKVTTVDEPPIARPPPCKTRKVLTFSQCMESSFNRGGLKEVSWKVLGHLLTGCLVQVGEDAEVRTEPIIHQLMTFREGSFNRAG